MGPRVGPDAVVKRINLKFVVSLLLILESGLFPYQNSVSLIHTTPNSP